ncbi:PAS domain S-box protein [Parvularcula sp. ZS-1/3]|uniref:histidine kinase n=1 Tax=Parvularcula mediterranea TaxID=2732508 RepID=A0A7Y3RLU9_9PROT|nr:histidine kinase dimerization/phosphoacceptor domain -containing protein [Parvularcula mediterranea]NNU16454.1 PAS domain S-box protein [Parvularcula mediterranea]
MTLVDELVKTLGLTRQPLLLAALDQLAEGVIVADEQGKLVFVNTAAHAIHGVKALDVAPEEYTETYQLLTVDEEPYPFEDLPLARAVMHGETVEDAHWKIKRPDGTIVDAVGTARPVLDSEGTQVASVLTLTDKTAELAAEKNLAAALEMKETLLYEVNHRVKNNLALISAMLRLQAKGLDGPGQEALRDISGRVNVLADVHGRLYQTGGHNEIEVVSFLTTILQDTIASLADEEVALRIEHEGAEKLTIDQAVPLSLAINEFTLNSIKHAFDEVEHPEISVRIEAKPEKLVVRYADNGCGLDPEKTQKKRRGIGQALITNLTSQLDAIVDQRTDAEGFAVDVTVPLKNDH